MVFFLTGTAASVSSDPLDELYRHLNTLREQTNGPYTLTECDGQLDWPDRGLYIFFDHDSNLRHDPPSEWTISRIGTVGVSTGSSNTLWQRLRTHRGTTSGDYEGGGNHRGSVWRRHVGRAIIERDGLDYPTWGTTHGEGFDCSTEDVRMQELPLERRVSDYIRDLPFLVVDVDDPPGPTSDRAYLEQNLIGLVSHKRRASPSCGRDEWVGDFNPRPEIHRTGLWNVQHTGTLFDQSVLQTLETYIESTDSPATDAT